jgi:hypothetical protein
MVIFQSALRSRQSAPYGLYYLNSDTVAQTNQYISAWEGEPTWQIVYISDFDNLVEAFQPIGVGAKNKCGCYTSNANKIAYCMESESGGCNPCNNHRCSTWEKIKTWIAETF